MTNNHLKHITEGLLEYTPPMNAVSKNKHAMRHTIRKPLYMPFENFFTRLIEVNNFLSLFPGLDASNMMPTENLKKILLHVVPNECLNQYYLQGWDFETKTFEETCDMLEQMEITEHLYERETPI